MASPILSAAHFHNEDAAFEYVESHLWPRGPVCPHCGAGADRIGTLNARSKPSKKHPEGVKRHGLRKCYACRMEFTVRAGSIFEESHLPLHLWLQAIHLMCSSKKGISTRQIQRLLQCSMKTAWHLTHRIRHAMSDSSEPGPMGGAGGFVEADETFIGRKAGRAKKRGGYSHKNAVLSLVERGGEVRSFHIDNVTAKEVGGIVAKNIRRDSTLMTDEGRHYETVGQKFTDHQTVAHTLGEYVRGDAHTNTIEGFFSVFKRGTRGVYQQCDEKHLHRYLAEFDFRYNAREALGVNDQQRTSRAVMGTKGKRLTYRRTDSDEPSLA